jgi:hypothetical protein
VLLALFIPILGATVFGLLAGGRASISAGDLGNRSLLFAGMGLAAWFTGWRWFGLRGLGLRSGRPLSAGIGLATLLWLAFLIVRFVFVSVSSYGTPQSGRTFIYILLFEAFCTQLWVFGLFFRSVAGWRGPLTAAVSSGVLFGAVAFLLFQESYAAIASSLLYFIVWGVAFGLIRLRAGSLLGLIIVQALQSWTAWYVLAPRESIDATQLRTLYLVTSAIYLIIIWRLWPRAESDYRV